MAAPETPQDRKPKASKATEDFTVTVAGRDWTVAREALDDFELLDDLGAVEAGNPARLPSVLRRLLGEQYAAALDTIRDEKTGRVGIEAGNDFVKAVFEALNQGNSSGS